MNSSFPDDWLYDIAVILQLLGTAGTVEKYVHLKSLTANIYYRVKDEHPNSSQVQVNIKTLCISIMNIW